MLFKCKYVIILFEIERGRAMKNFNVNSIVKIGIFSALVIVLSLTPFGLIPLPFLPIRITTVHIPIIIIAILEGKTVGFFVGLIFGLFSFFQHLSGISPLSFVFINPLVSVFPRAMIGLLSGYVYELTSGKSNIIRSFVASIVGSITNTFGVLFFMYIFFAKKLLEVTGINPLKFVLGIAFSNGMGEVIVACIIVPLVVLKLKKVKEN